MHGDIKIDSDVYGCCAKNSNWQSEKGKTAIVQLTAMGVKCFTNRGYGYLEQVTLDNQGQLIYTRAEG